MKASILRFVVSTAWLVVAIANPLDFRRIYVKRDARFISPPQPLQLSLFKDF